MADLLFVVVTVAFFMAAVGFVSLCDWIIGPDSEHGDPTGIGETDPDDTESNRAGDLADAGAVR